MMGCFAVWVSEREKGSGVGWGGGLLGGGGGVCYYVVRANSFNLLCLMPYIYVLHYEPAFSRNIYSH